MASENKNPINYELDKDRSEKLWKNITIGIVYVISLMSVFFMLDTKLFLLGLPSVIIPLVLLFASMKDKETIFTKTMSRITLLALCLFAFSGVITLINFLMRSIGNLTTFPLVLQIIKSVVVWVVVLFLLFMFINFCFVRRLQINFINSIIEKLDTATENIGLKLRKQKSEAKKTSTKK